MRNELSKSPVKTNASFQTHIYTSSFYSTKSHQVCNHAVVVLSVNQIVQEKRRKKFSVVHANKVDVIITLTEKEYN